MYFKHRSLPKYARMARDQDGVEIKSMKYLVQVKKDMLRYVQDVRAVRGMERGLSDHHVVLYKVGLVGAWIRRRELVVGMGRGKIGTEKDMLGLSKGRE